VAKIPAKKRPPEGVAPARYTMTSLEQVRIMAHPVRLRLLEVFAARPRTTHQAAQELDVPATRLYHHVNALERVGLIRLRETRPVRGTVEKYYEAVGRRFAVGMEVFSRGRKTRGAEELGEMVASVLEEARHDLGRALEGAADTPEELQPIALRAILPASPAQLGRLRARLLALLQGPPGRRGAKPGGERPRSRARVTLVFAFDPGRPADGAKAARPGRTRKTPA
jgi:hypothetical protein